MTVAESGTEAISCLSASPHDFNILLTDVMMPDMDGITLLRYVKTMPGTQDIAVVMMSANEQNNTVLECIQNGAADYFLKPVTKKDQQRATYVRAPMTYSRHTCVCLVLVLFFECAAR